MHRTISCHAWCFNLGRCNDIIIEAEITLFYTYRLSDEQLHCILKTVVRESCLLITKCQTVARDDFQKLLSTVPVCISVYQFSRLKAICADLRTCLVRLHSYQLEMVFILCRWSHLVCATSWLFRTTSLVTPF